MCNEVMRVAGVLDGVDKHTNLVGENRLELLMFRLGGRQTFGINVFKVQEVLPCPALTRLPQCNSVSRGLATIRGKTIPIIDLGAAIGQRPLAELSDKFIIIAEYNRTVQGFLVSSVDRIVNMNWKHIQPPPKGVGKNNYVTAITEVDGSLVEIIDVEKVLEEIVGATINLSEDNRLIDKQGNPLTFLVADDSLVARNQVKRTLQQLGVETILAENGKQALHILKQMAADGTNVAEKIALVISDIEMPEMDGYTLTTEIRADPHLKDLIIMLHTSLSGFFNQAMVKKVGADKFVPKFKAEELSLDITNLLAEKGRI